MIGRYCKSFKSIITLLLILLTLSSCDRGCVEADDFGSDTFFIKADRSDGAVSGSKSSSGEDIQIADPLNTPYITNGDPIVVKISGEWSAWGQLSNDNDMNVAQFCSLCFKKDGVNNCICKHGETPEKKKFNLQDSPNSDKVIPLNSAGGSVTHDCTQAIQQDDPNLCTCTKNASVDDLGVYFISTNHQDVSETVLSSDNQTVCKFNAGAGLYIGLYGKDGITTPTRLYHALSSRSGCDIPLTDNRCINSQGKDVSYYIFSSDDDRIFIKDDNNGNNGIDTDFSNDTYHVAGEKIKININDNIYTDNFGSYTLEFLGGIIKDEDAGLLESLVRFIEDILLGKFSGEHLNQTGDEVVNSVSGSFINEFKGSSRDREGVRQGGVLETMYNVIVKDSTFQVIVQLVLILYITFFGAGVLMGSVEISTKEMSTRVIKIALISLFVGFGAEYNAWQYYNLIIVGFFKYGLDSIISLFSNIVDSGVSDIVHIAKGSRNGVIDASISIQSASQADRFAYIDKIIIMFTKEVIHKKIWGLLFGKIFGFILIPLIYLLIVFFIYTVLTAAILYVTALLRMVVVMAIGPLFIIASLFTHTESMFKKWVTYLAARSLEILLLFLILYLFLDLIDFRIKELLRYQVCYTRLSKLFIGAWKIDTAALNGNRPFAEWISQIFSILALIFLLKVIIEKIPGLVSDLVSVSGTQTLPIDGNSFANQVMRSVKQGMISSAGSAKSFVARHGGNAITLIGKQIGADKVALEVRRAIPFKGAQSRKIDKAIVDATKEAKKAGHKGAELDRYVRTSTMNKMAEEAAKSGKVLKSELVVDRLNQELVEKPMKKFIKEKAKELTSDPESNLYGSQLSERLREETKKWAKENTSISDDSIEKTIRNLKSYSYVSNAFDVFKGKGSALENASPKSTTMAEKLSAEKTRHLSNFRGKYLRGQVAGRHVDFASDREKRTEAQKDYIDSLLVLGERVALKGYTPESNADYIAAEKRASESRVQKFIKNLDKDSRIAMEAYMKSGTEVGGRYSPERIHKKVKMIEDEYRSDLLKINPNKPNKDKYKMKARYESRLDVMSEEAKKSLEKDKVRMEALIGESRGVASRASQAVGKGVVPNAVFDESQESLNKSVKQYKESLDAIVDDAKSKAKDSDKDDRKVVDKSQLMSYKADLSATRIAKATAKMKLMQLQIKKSQGEKVDSEIDEAQKDYDTANKKEGEAEANVSSEQLRINNEGGK